MNKRLQDNERLLERSFDSISTQLSANELSVGRVSIVLTIFGSILAVLGIFLGYYIEQKHKQVEKLKSDSEELLKKTIAVKEEVERINSNINNSMSEVYKKIKREETVSLLDRLVNVPQDISNIIQLLLSRTLECTDFEKLKTAYLKLSSFNRLVNVPQDISNLCKLLLSRTLEEEDFCRLKTAYLKLSSLKNTSNWLSAPQSNYKILFFQHFFVQSIRDVEIKTDIIEFISDAINAAFENDIENTTKEFSILLKNEDISSYKDIIIGYFSGLSNSKFKYYKKTYEIFFETLNQRDKQFELFDTIVSNLSTRTAKIGYGQLLKNKYSQTELSDNKKSLDEFEKLKNEFKIEEIQKIESQIEILKEDINRIIRDIEGYENQVTQIKEENGRHILQEHIVSLDNNKTGKEEEIKKLKEKLEPAKDFIQ